MALANLISSSAQVAVVSGRVVLPRVGVWYADLVLAEAAGSALDGAVQLELGDATLKGTAHRLGDFLGRTQMRMVAGGGGLEKACTPKAYGNVPVRIPLTDICSSCGEDLSPESESAAISAQLPAWSTLAQLGGEAIAELVTAAGDDVVWRMLPDGTVWVGRETWPQASIDYQLVDSEPEYGRVKIASEQPTLVPGTALDLGNVSYVEHHITPDRVRTLAWLETAAAPFDRVKGPWVKVIRSALRKVDRHALYRARVVAQSADLTKLDVLPDSPYLPGYQDVPLRHGLPGVKVEISAGASVLIGFMNGDARAPYVDSWEGGESVQSIEIAGDKRVARLDDTTKNGTLIFVPGTGGASLTYVPPGGAEEEVPAGGTSIALEGVIDSASDVVKVA